MLRTRHLVLALLIAFALLPGLGSDLFPLRHDPQRLAPAAGLAAPASTPVYLPFVLRSFVPGIPTPTLTPTLTPTSGATPTVTPTSTRTLTPTITPTPGEGRIAFDSDRDGDWEVYAMNPAGANLVALTQNQGGYESQPAWSPDGGKIAFESNRTGNFEIYVMDADGANPTNLTQNEAEDWNPAW